MSPTTSISSEKPARLIGRNAVGRQNQRRKRGFQQWRFARCCWPHASRRDAEPRRYGHFAASKGLGDFEFATTGGGSPGEWSVVRDDATQALAQTGTDFTDDRFPLAIYRPFSGRNVYASIRFMPVAGKIDQAGGVVVRFTSAGDYYVARANALENNVRFYRVVGGKRQMIAGVDASVSSGTGTRSA